MAAKATKLVAPAAFAKNEENPRAGELFRKLSPAAKAECLLVWSYVEAYARRGLRPVLAPIVTDFNASLSGFVIRHPEGRALAHAATYDEGQAIANACRWAFARVHGESALFNS